MLIDELLPPSTPVGTADSEIERSEVVWSPASPADKTALKLVVQDAQEDENFIWSRGIPSEWDRLDRLFLATVQMQYWEGTGIPRAHLGIPLVLEHIESITPQIITGLFQQDPPFLSQPRPGASMQLARGNDALLGWAVDSCDFREQLRLGLKSALLYGNGVWKYGWRTCTKTIIEYRRKQAQQFTPLGVGGVTTPSEYSDEVEQVEREVEISEPTFEWIDLRHVLVSKDCRSHDIRRADHVTHRLYLTVEDLDELREYEGYNIPDRAKLVKILFPPKEEPDDNRTETSGSTLDVDNDFRYRAEGRSVAPSVDPLKQPLEILERWDDDKVITVVAKKLVIRNAPNEFHEKPFRSVGFVDVLGSWHALGIGYLIGNEQRMQQGVQNAFLDDLSLSLNGMFVRKRGTNTPTQQLRMRPGGVIDSDDEKGVNILQRQPIPIEVFGVLSASDARAQRRTAANEMFVQGVMPAEKSSITRTRAGVDALTSGAGARLQYFVENIADLVFVPTLVAFRKLIPNKLKPSQIQSILSSELNEAWSGDVMALVNAQFDITILATAKLAARKSLAQTLPLMWQYLTAEPVIQALAQEGKKVSYSELVNMSFDVSGFPNRQDVIIDMTADDNARMQQNNPAVQQAQAKAAQAQQDHANKLDLIEEENIARSGRDVVKAGLTQQLADNAPAPKAGKK
jgi:hypothetical protein